MQCCNEAITLKPNIMNILDKIKNVASYTEIYMIDLEFRTVVDECNNQSIAFRFRN